MTNKKVVEENLNLVHLCAKRFRSSGFEYDDIFQCGCMGLVKAVNSFDKSKNFKLSSYAVPYILGEIKQLFRNSNYLKVSRDVKSLSFKMKKESERFFSINDRTPTIKELSEFLNVTAEQVIESLEFSKNSNIISKESISLNISVNFEEEKIISKILISNLFKNLAKQDKILIYLRFSKNLTQSKIAKIMKKPQTWVSRREKSLVSELKKNP
ncbi:MAG: sigma-70 family RNA polymerase sigma factor [Candidatus Paraimprobicoccus trichonymphae]|uniref:Sigma-70 family RNA polymerase sigma factor n=1 Tax=Candidatus Paraimprobicoccus trichonymphae TaxID=3033793 RepID=A0AA48KVV1_9FIRM|nr:MAG: sigma-70 family RNA polymerase sigma factor [Candidatus Paraimprobicoccus trichonymphae]